MPEARNRPMMELAVAAFQQAARKVVERALQSGTPMLVWKDGAVVAMDPRQALNDVTAK
jgi:predicted dinucleotide-utilizing enzyme